MKKIKITFLLSFLALNGIAQTTGVEFQATSSGGPADPKFTFSNQQNMGMYRQDNNKLGLSANGQIGLVVDGSSGIGKVLIGGTGPLTANYFCDVRGSLGAKEIYFTDGAGTAYTSSWIGMTNWVEGANKWLHIGGINGNADNIRRAGIWADKIYLQGRVGIGTLYPLSNSKLCVSNSSSTPATGLGTIGLASLVSGAPQLDFLDDNDDDWAIHVNDKNMYFIQQPWQYNNSLVLNGSTGSVGIGTNTPKGKLHVKGSITPSGGSPSIAYFEENNVDAFIRIKANTAFKHAGIELSRDDNKKWIMRTGHTPMKLAFERWDGNTFVVAPVEFREDGIYTKKICVSPNGTCPDYVFEADYNLRSISELEDYVKENKHLPNVPSAKDIDKDGSIDVSSMTYAMLEKIEELTLYVIQQQKEIEELKKKNK